MSQNRQSAHMQQGEIAFRRMLRQQELSEMIHHPEILIGDEIMPVLADRIEETRQVFAALSARPITLAPFLELGAERAQRSLAVRNEFDKRGFAIDLSLDALQSAEWVRQRFGFAEMPLRVCGDAYNLPFRSNVFPFVFCFATLHHFPDPLPIVRESLRVLQDGGHFYFDGEPTRGRLALRLWVRRGHRLSRPERWLSRIGILGFVSEGGGLEREYGVLENAFPLETWLNCIELFAHAEMQVNRTLRIQFDPSRPSLKRHMAKLLGGVTRGLCFARKDEPPTRTVEWVEMLRCPTCGSNGNESRLMRMNTGEGLECPVCGVTYPQINGILVLLTPEQRQVLYPELRLD